MTLEEKKARLEELKAKLAQMKQSAAIDAERSGLKSAAERLMSEDPLSAFNLMDKSRALDIREMQAARERGLGSSEEVRRQLRMNADRAARNSLNPDLDKKVQARYLEEEAVYLAESEKDSPSLQAAAIAVGELRRGGRSNDDSTQKNEAAGAGAGEVTEESALANLRVSMGNLKYKDEAVQIKPAFLRGIASLGEESQNRLEKIFDAEAAALPNRPGKNEETKEEYNAWKSGFDDSGSMKGIAAGIGLGQAMNTSLKNYKPGSYLSQGDAQKLAAMIYVTYNPGTLQAGEMTSAINAVKDGKASDAAIAWFKNKLGIQGLDRVPIDVAIKQYNDGLSQGSLAYKELQEALNKRREGGKKLVHTDNYLMSFKDPSTYKLNPPSLLRDESVDPPKSSPGKIPEGTVKGNFVRKDGRWVPKEKK